MFKRLLFIGICLCLVAMAVTDADARCRLRDGKWKCSDLCPFTSGVGAGNVDENTLALCIGLSITEASIEYCENPAGNAIPPIGSGTPFSPITFEPGVTEVTADDLTGIRGGFEVEGRDYDLCFSWENDIWPPVIAAISDACPNDWWTPTGPRIDTMYGYHAAYQERQGLLVRSSALCVECVWDPTSTVCEDVNPITCTVLPNTSKCEEEGIELDIACDLAIANQYNQ